MLRLVLLAALAGCVINTRPQLPDEDGDGGRVNIPSQDASFAGDAGVTTGGTGSDASAFDTGVPPAAAADASTTDASQTGALESDTCRHASSWRDAGRGDAGTGDAAPDGAADVDPFVDQDGRACDPTRDEDAGRNDAGGARDGDPSDGRAGS